MPRPVCQEQEPLTRPQFRYAPAQSSARRPVCFTPLTVSRRPSHAQQGGAIGVVMRGPRSPLPFPRRSGGRLPPTCLRRLGESPTRPPEPRGRATSGASRPQLSDRAPAQRRRGVPSAAARALRRSHSLPRTLAAGHSGDRTVALGPGSAPSTEPPICNTGGSPSCGARSRGRIAPDRVLCRYRGAGPCRKVAEGARGTGSRR